MNKTFSSLLLAALALVLAPVQLQSSLAHAAGVMNLDSHQLKRPERSAVLYRAQSKDAMFELYTASFDYTTLRVAPLTMLRF